jgi:outer membrane protein TolC
MKTVIIFCLLIIFGGPSLFAQDTLRVSLQEFIERGIERSGQVQYDYGNVRLAENRVQQARSTRILPSINLNTNHGLIPGVRSQTGLPREHLYLDPNLENDWEDWAIFTRAEINAVQPLFAWGAINSAINAAEYGAQAAKKEFEARQKGVELMLYELYHSYLLATEVDRILTDAESTVNQIGRELERMQDENDPDLRERDIFEYEIFTSEFEIQKMEVRQSIDRIQRIWNYAMGGDPSAVYIPMEEFLDPVPFDIEPFDYYQELAMDLRPELQGVDAGVEAYKHSVEAIKSQNLPSLYLGLTASYANTPNRPRQSNPFIINNSNYATAAVGFGIRQNLNFSSIRNRVERERIEYNRVKDLRNALSDGIMLELNEQYMEAVVAETKVKQLQNALRTTRNWVRHEQLNYDYGFGDVEDLVDSVRKELELRVELTQSIFEMNKKVAALYHASGLPITNLSLN